MPIFSKIRCCSSFPTYTADPALAGVSTKVAPSTMMVPFCIVSNCPKQRRKVDLPDPEGPIMDTTSPRSIDKDTSCKTAIEP